MITVNLKQDRFPSFLCTESALLHKEVKGRKYAQLYIHVDSKPQRVAVPKTSFLFYRHFIYSLVFSLFQFCDSIT